MTICEQDSSAVWRAQSDFYLPRRELAAVGAFLGMTDEQVRAELARGRLGPPLAEEPKRKWSPDQIYQYVLAHQPGRQDRIPRLYPFDSDIKPARFMFSQEVRVSAGRFAVHAWEPADQRGAIAVAYSTSDDFVFCHKSGRGTVDQLVAAMPWASAVAVPGAELRAVRADGRWEYGAQPYVVVGEPGKEVTEVGWCDVANLVRCDLPYWSAKLCEHEAILAWRPGAPVQKITTIDTYCPAVVLRGIVTAQSSPPIGALVERAIGYQRREVVSDYAGTGHDGLPERPGLCQAAVADIDWSAPAPAALSEAEQALLLHHPYSGAAPWVKYAMTWGVIEDTMTFTPATAGRLAQEWISRLAPAGRTELGHSWLCQAYNIPPEDATALCDPLWPDQWIIAFGDTMCATVSYRVVAASGQLVEFFAAEDNVAFFRDSAGRAWPMPSRGQYRTGGGPDSTGSDDLTRAVANLVCDAHGDVRRAITVDKTSALSRWITTTKSPLHIPVGHPALSPTDFIHAD